MEGKGRVWVDMFKDRLGAFKGRVGAGSQFKGQEKEQVGAGFVRSRAEVGEQGACVHLAVT